MKYSVHSIKALMNKAHQEGKPTLMFRLTMHSRLIRHMQKNTVSYFSGFRILAPQLATYSIIFALFMTSGITTLYAYSNPNITTGNPLYSLKIGAENVEKMFAFSPEQKAEVFSKLAKRRSEEAKIIAEKTGSINYEVIEEVKTNNIQAITHVKSVSENKNIEKTKDNIVSNSAEQKENLVKVKNIAVDKVKEEKQVDKDVLSLEDKSAIFLSAPVTMENVSVRDQMLIQERTNSEYGLVNETSDKLVISGFLPEDEELITEEELMEDSPEIQLIETALEEVEGISDKNSLDKILDEYNSSDNSLFIN